MRDPVTVTSSRLVGSSAGVCASAASGKSNKNLVIVAATRERRPLYFGSMDRPLIVLRPRSVNDAAVVASNILYDIFDIKGHMAVSGERAPARRPEVCAGAGRATSAAARARPRDGPARRAGVAAP